MEAIMIARAQRQRIRIVNKNDLIALLNEDFARECRSIYAHAVFAERYRTSDPGALAEIEKLGHESVRAALTLCQMIYDYGGTVEDPGDELNFVLNADRVAEPRWAADTILRLRMRIGQLRAIGEPGLAKRLRPIVAAKRAAPDLASLLP
jgi:hypothetical protein